MRFPAWLLLTSLALSAAFAPGAALADLVDTGSRPSQPSAGALTLEQTRLLAENPILAELRRENPEALGPILEDLEQLTGQTRKGLPHDRLDPVDRGILETNPSLELVFRESPEAALDLIRLIREAVNR